MDCYSFSIESSSSSIYVAGPFGLCCRECDEPVGGAYVTADAIRKHNKRKGHVKSANVAEAAKLYQIEVSRKRVMANRSISFAKKFLTGETVNGFACDNCNETFSRKENATRHTKSKKNLCTDQDVQGSTLCITTCGRCIDQASLPKTG